MGSFRCTLGCEIFEAALADLARAGGDGLVARHLRYQLPQGLGILVVDAAEFSGCVDERHARRRMAEAVEEAPRRDVDGAAGFADHAPKSVISEGSMKAFECVPTPLPRST